MLPLGVDLGASRVRVAALATGVNGHIRLLAVGAADVDGDLREALRLALGQISTPERRCIASIRSCDARLRSIRFPNMRDAELRRAVRFEGVSMFGEHVEEQTIAVRSATIGTETLVTAAPAMKVREIINVLTSCGLRVLVVDHEACIQARARQLPLLDIGFERSTLLALVNGVPFLRSFPFGGTFFTDALAREFGTSRQIAEIRKRTIGLGGAGNDALDAYMNALRTELDGLDRGAFETLFVCGNGARLESLREKITECLGVRAEPVDLPALVGSDLPPEVEHLGAFDWFGAVATALPSTIANAA
ncbi:MAG TPA: pilus assembly protein PilM [Candidatus Baltobacteraceae bacterium]